MQIKNAPKLDKKFDFGERFTSHLYSSSSTFPSQGIIIAERSFSGGCCISSIISRSCSHEKQNNFGMQTSTTQVLWGNRALAKTYYFSRLKSSAGEAPKQGCRLEYLKRGAILWIIFREKNCHPWFFTGTSVFFALAFASFISSQSKVSWPWSRYSYERSHQWTHTPVL